MYNINYHIEENFISELIFQDKKLTKKDFKGINYDKLAKVASNYLILPSLYKKIHLNNYKTFLPEKFYNYLKEIYDINKKRNIELLEEISKHSKLLNSAKINYVFLKGSAMILIGKYENLDRMVGDIDILVCEKDFTRAIKLFKKEGFKEVDSYNFFQKHYPRMSSKKNVFAIEIHNNLSMKKIKNFDSEKFLKSKVNLNDTYVPSKENILKHIIYNDQVNDNGYKLDGYNLRAYYDYNLLYKSVDKKLNLDKYQLNFLRLLQNFTKIDIGIGVKRNKWLNLKLYLIKNYKFFHNLNYLCFKLYYAIKFKIMQLKEICFNKKYREYCLNKLFKIKDK